MACDVYECHGAETLAHAHSDQWPFNRRVIGCSPHIYTYSAQTCPQTTQTQTHTYTHLFCIYIY